MGAHRRRARLSLLGEALGEEQLQGRGDEAHGRDHFSRRAAANSSSSGNGRQVPVRVARRQVAQIGRQPRQESIDGSNGHRHGIQVGDESGQEPAGAGQLVAHARCRRESRPTSTNDADEHQALNPNEPSARGRPTTPTDSDVEPDVTRSQ